MVVGKIKTENKIKLFLFFIFIVFFIQNLINNDLPNESINVPTNSSYKVIITGGSNAMYGLRAESFESNFGRTANLSLVSEGGIFLNYSNWLKKINASTHIVIYSPISFWDAKENEFEDLSLIQQFQSLFPKISLTRYIVNLFVPPSNIYLRNTVGDLEKFDCKNDLPNWKSSVNYVERAMAASRNFKKRMAIIRDATHADIVVLRIPPLLVSAIDKAQIEKDIRAVVASYRDQGILVLEEPVWTSVDKSLFCDYAHHPNEAGRIFFTENFISALKKIP
jgi:hypothetical protein